MALGSSWVFAGITSCSQLDPTHVPGLVAGLAAVRLPAGSPLAGVGRAARRQEVCHQSYAPPCLTLNQLSGDLSSGSICGHPCEIVRLPRQPSNLQSISYIS